MAQFSEELGNMFHSYRSVFSLSSVIPGFFLVLFSKEVEEGRCDKEESNTIDFFFFKK